MRIVELINFIKARVDGDYYANKFSIDGTGAEISVKLTGGFPTSKYTGLKRPSFQILVRGESRDGAGAEDKAFELYDALTNLSEVQIGESSIVQIRCNNSAPLYLGDDESDRPIYSLNFDCVERP
ncbi:minor capsid protein [Bacillus sp. FSL R5-0659]|uniref:minor capsid protein n=1 Tax=Bacillus sp. FSL R5-0659 TaxID=2954590 RepID=UPI0030F4DBEB